MPMVQGRLPIASDFEDISLFDAKDIKRWRAQRDSQSSQESNSSEGNSDDPHGSLQSVSSTISTPTLASDTSSLRSSMCSLSSPALVNTQFGGSTTSLNQQHTQHQLPSDVHPLQQQLQRAQHEAQSQQSLATINNHNLPKPHQSVPTSNGYRRRKSVPTLIDNTSMASLTIQAQSSSRTRKQREQEYEKDQDDEIWPEDGLMFNVPMSPALYAQQRNKQHQQQQKYPQHHGNLPSQSPQTQFALARKQSLGSSSAGQKGRQGLGNTPSNPNLPPLQGQQASRPTPASNSQRRSLPSIYEHSDGKQHSSKHEPRRDSKDEFYFGRDDYRHRSVDSAGNASMSSLPNLLWRRGSQMSDSTASIEGLDHDTSDLTLELCRLEQQQELQRHSGTCGNDTADTSIASLSMMEDNGSLPSPSLGSVRSSEDDGSGRDSRRSSLTRPDNLPPKSPEEDRKHMKEYEKLLKTAASAEKRKQQKHEEDAKQRAHQVKLDTSTWSYWLSKNGKSKLSSNIKWRGVPERLRSDVWKFLKADGENRLQFTALPPPITVYRCEIIRDSECTWPECGIFGQGRPLHESLIQVVEQFLACRPEIRYAYAVTGIASLLLLYLDESDSITVMMQIIKPGSFAHAVLSGNERLASANYVSFGKVFRKTFIRLSEHFAKVNLDDTELLNPMVASLFTTVVSSPEAAARIIDVYLFDGDSFLLRAALGFLRINEAWLYATKDEILDQLQNSRPISDDEMMEHIRGVTKG